MTISSSIVRSVRFTSAIALATALAMPAFAQEAAEEEQTGAIRDIIVTAQKREENIQSVPIAISAFDATALDSATIEDIRDLAGRVPSLVVDSVGAGPSSAAISIRGISFEDIEKSFDPAVGVVVDGVFIGTNTGQLLDSFDMERLEVLRGPQGTLFGRNTIGGVISVTRSRPTEEFGIKAQAAYSTYDTKRGRLVVNTGKIGGIIALKAFGFYDKTDGFYRNVTKNKREGAYEVLTGGITALITPSDKITAQITYEHMRERGETIVSPLSKSGELICLFPGAPGFSPAVECNRSSLEDKGLYTTFSSIPTPVSNDTDAISANIDIDIGALKLSSVTGYRKNDESVRQDFDASSARFFETLRAQQYEQFSQELRLAGDISDGIDFVLGGYYFTSNYQILQNTNFGAVLGQGAPLLLTQAVDHKSTSYAGFVDTQIKLSDALTLGLGGRYTRDKKEIFNNYGRVINFVRASIPGYTGVECVGVTGVFTPPDPRAGLPIYAAANNCSGAKSFGKFTWRGHLDYDLGNNKLAYASVSRGFRSGGFNGRSSGPTTLGPYEPETVDAYEIGFKGDWLDRKLRTNIAFYYTKYKNKQEEVVQPSPPGSASPQETVVRNASSADIKGIELEVIAQLSDNLSFNASASYTDAQYNRFFNDVVGLTAGSAPDGRPDDVSTLTLRRAPKYQWSVGLNYTKDLGSGTLDFNTLLRLQAKYQTCITPATPRIPGNIVNDPRCQTEDREDLVAQLGYTIPLGDNQEIKVSVFGRNLTNHKGLSATLPVAGLFTFGTGRQPRTMGVEVGFKF